MEGYPGAGGAYAGIAAGIASASASKALAASSSSAAHPPKYKKAPDAPKRFKSAFIIFSSEKHKEIKEDLAKQGRAEKTTDIAKLVSEAWREMPTDEKEEWEKKARKDKARYEVEKAMYKGPWKVPANKRTPKDPTAPKRPMSAFLAFSNKRRAGLKREHPDATNADLSKMLSKTWKTAPDELKKKYMEEEAALRATYKVEMAKWRKKAADEKKVERQEREAIAMQAAEARQSDAANGLPVGSNPATAAMASQYNAVTGQSNNTNAAGQGSQDMGGGMGGAAAQMYGHQHPYANMGGPQFGGMGGFGGMPTDPSQYANLMGAGGFGPQAGFMGGNAQQQLLSQLFGQQFKQPMGNLGMYQGFPGQGMPGQQGMQGQHGMQMQPGMQQQQPQPGQGGQQQEQQQQGQQQQMGMPQGFAGGYNMDMQRAMMAAQQQGQMNMMGQQMGGGGQGMMMGGGGGNMGAAAQQGGEQEGGGGGGGENPEMVQQQQEQQEKKDDSEQQEQQQQGY